MTIDRSALEISRRAIAAQSTADFGICAAHYANAPLKKQGELLSGHQRMVDWMAREKVFAWLSPWERRFFDTGLVDYTEDPDDAAFELESVGILLWALGLADAPGTSRPSDNNYHELLHASDSEPDASVVSDAGCDPTESPSARSAEQVRTMADAYRLQVWRIDLVVEDKKARVDMHEVAPQLVGDSASQALELLSLYKRNGDLVFDAASLVFYDLYKRDIPWIRRMFIQRLKTLEWLIGHDAWDDISPEQLLISSLR